MIRLVCPICLKALNLGIWDGRSGRVYCAECIPPLPRRNSSASKEIKKTIHNETPDILNRSE